MNSQSSAFTTLDFNKLGKQVGYFSIPHSPHEDAWGTCRIPMAVIANGEGPTVILQGGNHGDEYEGPITLGEIIRELDPASIQGRLIILPSINASAVASGKRTSPVDGLNLNRCYPGDHIGTLTEQTAAYINDYIYPIGDAFLDLHSGGSSLEFIPSAIVQPTDDLEHTSRNVTAVKAFDAPLTVVVDNLGETRTATAAAVAAGLTTVGTELAGAGTVNKKALSICRRGVRNVLSHLGVLDQPIGPQTSSGDILKVPGTEGFVFAEEDGVFESFHNLGDKVRAGEPAGQLHHLLSPERPPLVLRFARDGIIYARRPPGRVRRGNCCLVVAVPEN